MSLFTLATGSAGPRVAYLHGLFGQGRNWMQIAKAVSGTDGEETRALLVDLPNHGRSPWTEEFSFHDYADAVVETLEAEAPGERWTVVGHSLGGKTAMVAALDRPDLIERLCVVDVAPRDYGGMGRFSKYVEEMQRLPLAEIGSRSDAEELFQESNPGVKAFLLQNLRRDGDTWRWQTNLDLVARDIEAGVAGLMGGWSVERADPFPHPVLWLVGADSDYVTEVDVEPMRALFPLVRQVTVKGAGHWVHTEAPDIVIGALRRFIL
ncbi:alpha/beta fold hydrolase [Nostocoides sp. F2B08]|uniref:alpha/beta fold hydrolase n=1 Tax=Nostocoides sp. F2B08 TaxID=2653936 RepID=UPI001263351E|nr:alpha/beta fold hydrolase [Tetrasphaera sp. F2B08]KAB7746053.1 alpha/beta fold hydrolase [Tetrasphaera sp. F2B08]